MLETKYELRNEFINFCQEEKRTETEKIDMLDEILDEYSMTRELLYEKHHQEFADSAMNKLYNKDNSIGGMNIKRGLKKYDLGLWANIRLTIWILISVVALLVLIYPFFVNTILVLILIEFTIIIEAAIIYFEKSRYIRYERRETSQMKSGLFRTQSNFKRKLRSNQFNNGNYKFGKLSKELSLGYKSEIIDKLPNQYELDEPIRKKIVGVNFPELGGVYAGEYHGEVIYIGKANNFRRRMKEHLTGLTEFRYNERKYNVGVNPDNLIILLLAFTQDEDEQSVLETIFFEKYDNGKLLNSTGTLSMEKILKRDNYKEALFRVKSK